MNHHKESEHHKPKLSESTMSDKKNLVLLATKRDLRDVSESPSTVLHYVLVCKDDVVRTNPSQHLPLVLSKLLQEFQDVFPDELPPGLPPKRGIEHRIDLILEHRFLTRHPTASTPKKQRKYKDKSKNSYIKGMHVRV